MGDGNSLINFGDLTKPATVLIEKISDAIGGIFRPYQIERVATAEGEAAKIRALADIEISDIQQRAIVRLVQEEGKKQENIERITAQSIKELTQDAKPEKIDNDWIVHFFDKCRLVSDDEMQSLWAKLLAGEANNPGAISKRCVELVSILDKSDAHLFTNLCSFGWMEGQIWPMIYDEKDEIYTERGITFGTLKHLDDIGLITCSNVSNFKRLKIPKDIYIQYYGTQVRVEFRNERDNELSVGKVLLSKVGEELAPISGSHPVPGFLEYVIENWTKQGITVTTALPSKPDK